jgi:type IV pilus assembly protein PilC
MAVAAKKAVKEFNYVWEGMDKKGKRMKGDMRATGEAVVSANLRRQGISVSKVKKQSTLGRGKKITEKDIALFTRQFATMLKSGVPLLQSFDIVAKGHSNPSVAQLLTDVKNDVSSGSSLAQAFSKRPIYFDALFCNLVNAGEQAGILDGVLDRLADYKEKILAIKAKIKSALFYPSAILVVAFIITAIIMIFVIPVFADLFKGFGADLPAPTLVVMAMSSFFVKYWWAIFGILIGGVWFFFYSLKRSKKMQDTIDRLSLKAPVFGELLEKSAIARWSRTLSTMFAAGVPLVEALDSVAGSAGNQVYFHATKRIQGEVSTGTNLTSAMSNTGLFPNMVIQMVQIGEESGQLDSMLSKVADYYDREVDDIVERMSALLEPIIMVILGVLIGGLVVSMYLPIFKMGQAI